MIFGPLALISREVDGVAPRVHPHVAIGVYVQVTKDTVATLASTLIKIFKYFFGCIYMNQTLLQTKL